MYTKKQRADQYLRSLTFTEHDEKDLAKVNSIDVNQKTANSDPKQNGLTLLWGL